MEAQSPYANLIWAHPPAELEMRGSDVLWAKGRAKTDFWQTTFYGFQRDNGHAGLTSCKGPFSTMLEFEGHYRDLYDQAGLMIRVDATRWVKFGVEYTDAETHLSAVVTNGVSDWSARPIKLSGPLAIRATRLDDALLLEHRTDRGDWAMARLAPFGTGLEGFQVGPYLCSPEGAGFEVQFTRFSIGPPEVQGLHQSG